MQRFAFDKNRQLTPAARAEKQQDYYCRECFAPVRLRQGLHRTTHFFHLKNTLCRQGQKSQTHLRIQEYLQNILGREEALLEKQFPQIGRIADLVWEKEKIIFEIQCSPITPDEIAGRNSDYALQGYQVIWILHDRLYNRWRMTRAEVYLRDFPHYFSNMDASGRGGIYDQVDCISRYKRKIVKKIFGVDWTRPQRVWPKVANSQKVPDFLRNRSSKWKLYFSGDLTDRWMQNKIEADLRQGRLGWIDSLKKAGHLVCRNICRFYLALFQMILEKTTR